MKTYKIILALVICSLMTIGAFSQISQNNRISQYSIDFSKSDANNLGKVSGKQYINESFASAKISNYDSSTLLRYNPYKDEMEFMRGEEIFYLNKHEGIKIKFVNENKTYIIKSVGGKLMYFVEVFKGEKVSFLIKEKVKYTPETPAANSYSSAKPATFSRSPDVFYVAFGDGPLVEFPRKKKQVIKLFQSNSIELKGYLKKNKISFKKEKDVLKMVKDANKM
ncbi:hypothetical protein [Pseudotenacibaculum haliotis]|uniref:Uncharacterized protein n=1 Tax=Pseudotenacibaculum haliotis TaxID=1862138 RepID=A0ABW5LR40_9FLAO